MKQQKPENNSLRDQIATQAIAGMAAGILSQGGIRLDEQVIKSWATIAYKIADAMLEVRNG